MGSSSKKKDKDRDRSREERREKKKKRRSRSGSRERDRESRHHHKHHKHKKQRSKKKEDRPLSLSPSFSEDSLSEVEELLHIKDESSFDYGGKSSSKAAGRTASPPMPPSPPHLAPPPPPLLHQPPPPPPPPSYEPPVPSVGSGSGGNESLSIEETNKIRAKLGLKPLQVEDVPKKEDNEEDEEVQDNKFGEFKVYKDGSDEFVHKPAENLAKKLQVEKLREKIAAQREKRRIKEKISKVKTLGESDSDDDSASAWVTKSRKLSKERQLAEQKSKMLEELDAQFGIGELVEQEMNEKKQNAYSYSNLGGLKVQHDIGRFEDGRSTILTLKDSNILEGEEDTLVNVNMMDMEQVERNLKRKRMDPDEKEYDAPEVDEFGNIVMQNSNLLKKYDEEISGRKMQSFRLGLDGIADPTREEYNNQIPDHVRKLGKLKKLQSLELPQTQLATEYLTPNEMVSFRKVKKPKKKKKKKFSVEDLEPIEEDNLVHLGGLRGAREARLQQIEEEAEKEGDVEEDSRAVPERVSTLRNLLEEDEIEEIPVKMETEEQQPYIEDEGEPDDIELQEAISRSRRAKAGYAAQPSSEKITEMIKKQRLENSNNNDEEDDDDDGDDMDTGTVPAAALNITLNTTDEFCRTLGDIPTYGLSGNRAYDDQSMLQLQQPKEKEITEPRGAWEEVGIDDTRVEIGDSTTTPILEEEPDASKGVANALKLAVKKGYLEKNNLKKNVNSALQNLRAIHYSIEDKTVEEDRGRGRGERYMGPVTDFREKDLYKPDVKLEYVDDDGRKLNAKEAFRYLSHKFHGKGSGKNKTEKRMKKWNEELLMKHMSSSDTPLQTLERQREKQKQLGAAYLVLSGSKTQESMDVKK